MREEWDILEKVGEEIYYFLNSVGRENYEYIFQKIQCSCGGDIKISAYKYREDESLTLRAKCENCKYSASMIFRPYEDGVKRRLLGNEYFFTHPTALVYVSKYELGKIILGLEKGVLGITFIDLDEGPFLEAKLSPIKGTTLYSIYEMSKREKNNVHVFFEPEKSCRYSLIFLNRDSEKKLVPLQDKSR